LAGNLGKSRDARIDFRLQIPPPADKCEIATAYVPVIGEPGNQEAVHRTPYGGKQIIRKSGKWYAEHTLQKWIPASAGMTVGIGQFE
jgi:hypothetical protein